MREFLLKMFQFEGGPEITLFSIWHIMYIVLIVGLTIGLAFILKNKSQKAKDLTLKILAILPKVRIFCRKQKGLTVFSLKIGQARKVFILTSKFRLFSRRRIKFCFLIFIAFSTKESVCCIFSVFNTRLIIGVNF